jgi:hypothetical protein
MDDDLGLEEYIIDMDTIDDQIYEIPKFVEENRPAQILVPLKEEIKFFPETIKIKKWELPKRHEPLTIVCVGRNRSGKSYIASKICEAIYEPDMDFYYIHTQDACKRCYDIFNKAKHIDYYDASGNVNEYEIGKLELGKKRSIVVAEQFWWPSNYSRDINEGLRKIFFRKDARPENTLYIQAVETYFIYGGNFENIDYIILNKSMFSPTTKELYRRLELSRLFGSHSFFHNLYSKIVNSNVYGKMVIHLSTKSSNIEDYVFFLNYDFEEEGEEDYITFTSKKTE